MSGAEFSIDGDAFANLGYDAAHNQVLDLQLEGEPTARKVVFSQVQKSEGAPDLVFSPADGQPVTPGGVVQTTMPADGAHAWIVRCQVNDGIDASAEKVAAWTKERAVVIRADGKRKICPAESTQYSGTYGWSTAHNELVDLGGGAPHTTFQQQTFLNILGLTNLDLDEVVLPDDHSFEVVTRIQSENQTTGNVTLGRHMSFWEKRSGTLTHRVSINSGNYAGNGSYTTTFQVSPGGDIRIPNMNPPQTSDVHVMVEVYARPLVY